MKVVPGTFYSTGHDYRGDTAWFVSYGLGFDVSPDQLALMETAGVGVGHARLTAATEAPEKKTKGARWFSRWVPHHHNGHQANVSAGAPAVG